MRAALAALLLFANPALAQTIDRHALVTRHNISLTKIDPHAPLMLGNGNLGFTADITGLQTFPEQYSPLAPLLTMAQWAWHSFPNPNGYTEADGLVQVHVPGRGSRPYPWIRDWAEIEQRPALKWLRENPHRFNLARIGLVLKRADGSRAAFSDLSGTRQHLDLWTGTLTSSFTFDRAPVTVETRVDALPDRVLVTVRSPLVASGRVAVEVRYPGVSTKLNPDPSDWEHDERHHTRVDYETPGHWVLDRRLDGTAHRATIEGFGARIARTGPHRFEVTARSGERIDAAFDFGLDSTSTGGFPDDNARGVAIFWKDYWTKGGAIDFSGSTDPRAKELERRVVLSQYLALVNQAGTVPPQEEGLFSNSWNGKFHLEMHAWHAGHWPQWGRPYWLERSLKWYLDMLPAAQALARRHGVEGAWWTKMAGPNGWNSPSVVNPFIMWQQPHPIYLAELVRRAGREKEALRDYGALVEKTAKLLASWPRYEADKDRYVLGPPIIPVQENHPPLTTVNPAFEVEYFRWGLETAQKWRERTGKRRDPKWDKVIAKLAPPPERDGLYLPAETAPDFWTNAASPACRRHAEKPPCLNRDHPSMLMASSVIHGARVDAATMRRTLRAVEAHWDLRQTWGWDYPMIAMTAARLSEREAAVDWLFRAAPNNRWGVSGMTPRVHLDAEKQLVGPAAGGAGPGPDGPGFTRAAETYFPSNGALLLAVGMMAAGWDGSSGPAPGFPMKGWKVRVEGVRPLP